MLQNPNIQGMLVWNAAKLALEDDYLYNLMVDWAKEIDQKNKDAMLKEVIDYTDEILRKLKVKKEN